MEVLPYKHSKAPKKEQVARMFDNISKKYDFLNHALSFHIDKCWRNKAIRLLGESSPRIILDVATGTADFAISACKLNPEKIIGVDISEGMLKIGREKIENKCLDNIIELQVADSEELPFEQNYFDSAIAGFGVRNFESLNKGLSEVLRVLNVGGKFYILEFSKPEKGLFRVIFNFYFKRILPIIGKVVSKDKSAYKYLHDSVSEFPSGKQFCDVLKKAGYINIELVALTFGVATIYIAEKPKSS